ncbi:DoxX family membrane protein [Formosa sp. S-31]|uniref:DoxX family membrane protein n=1 Tax=Formosa sp. S-31 TaxID=2790949 RepID=UPI003EC03FA5
MKNPLMHTAVLVRLPLAISFLGHGLIRLPKLFQFAAGMEAAFEATILPGIVVYVFALILPIMELVLGVLLLSGFKVRQTASVGVLLMCVLILGSVFQENWSAVVIQMFYGLYLTGLYGLSEAAYVPCNLKD